MGSQKTVLIADDDRAIVSALKARIKRLGARTITAYDTFAAVVRIKEHVPDVVCLDLDMPGGTGLGICEMLSFDSRKKNLPVLDATVPIVVMSGRSDSTTVERCLEFGAHYVRKDDNLWNRMEPVLRHILFGETVDLSQTRCPARCVSSRAAAGAAAEPDAAIPEFPPANGAAPDDDRILVIEDDPGIVDVIRHYLSPFNVVVEHCDNPAEVQQRALSAAAVLCDVHLPGIRGTFIVRELRDAGYSSPLIIITGDSTRLTAMECARSRVDGILLKPFNRLELLKHLEHVPGISRSLQHA